MEGKELSEMLRSTRMEKDTRKLALRDKMASAEDIAIMSDLEVCNLIVEEYEVLTNKECVLLIPKDKIIEFSKMAVFLWR